MLDSAAAVVSVFLPPTLGELEDLELQRDPPPPAEGINIIKSDLWIFAHSQMQIVLIYAVYINTECAYLIIFRILCLDQSTLTCSPGGPGAPGSPFSPGGPSSPLFPWSPCGPAGPACPYHEGGTSNVKVK